MIVSQITAIVKFGVIRVLEPTSMDKFANCAPFRFDLRRGESADSGGDFRRLDIFVSPSLAKSDDESSDFSSNSFSESVNRPG